MKKCIIVVLLLIAFVNVYGQKNEVYEKFTIDFKTAVLNKYFTGQQLNEMFRKYDLLLTPHSDVTRLTAGLRGDTIKAYPLYNFKFSSLYIEHIDYLLNSTNANHRILAYLVIASSYDISKQEILLKKIKTEKTKGNLIWAGMALLYLKCDHTTPIFDFLVVKEDFGDAHMLPLFIQLNKDSLRRTAYNRIHSDNVKAKILAAQTLSVLPLSDESEQLLKEAVKDWDYNLKGYAIYSLRALRIGNLLTLLKPLLDSNSTRSISLGALANSPTTADVDYVKDLAESKDTLDSELLNSLYESKNIENIRFWLKLLYTKPIPRDYSFFIFDQPLIKSGEILPDLQVALKNVKSTDMLGELVRALDGRTDDISVEIMIDLLKNDDKGVKYWAAKTLENNGSVKVQSLDVQKLIAEDLKDQ